MSSIIPFEKVALSFSRKEVKNYNNWAFPQNKAAEALVSFYSEHLYKNESSFLDAGCGTGLLTKYLLYSFPRASVKGIDIASPMIEEYKKINPSSSCIGNMEYSPYKTAAFDTTLSSFAIHWTDIKKTIKEFTRISKASFAFNIPIKGSIAYFNFPFYEEDYIIELVERYSKRITISTKKIDIPYKGFDLIKYFHYTGVSKLNPQKPIKSLMKKQAIEKFIKQYKEDFFYKMLYIGVSL